MSATAAIDTHRVIDKVRFQVADVLAAFQADNGHRTLSREDREQLGHHLIGEALEGHARTRLAAGRLPLSPETEELVRRAVFDLVFRTGVFQPLLDDPRIEDVIINGCDETWLILEDGTKIPGPRVADSDEELIELIRDAARRYGLSERQFDPTHPELNLQLPDGSRLFAIAFVSPRPSVSIRRHRLMRVNLDDLMGLGTIDLVLRELLAAAVRARLQLIVGGKPGVGKTTMLRSLAAAVPADERIVTIETELELGLDRFPDLHHDVVPLESREPNVEGVGAVTPAQLVRASLRMRPDRVIVGEARGAEVIPMMNAMSQGTAGSMCTIHADSSDGVFLRLAAYAYQAPERLPLEATNLLVASAINLVVFMNQRGNQRFVSSIREVVGTDGPRVVTNEIFAPGPDGRAVPAAPLRIPTLERLCEDGFDPSLLHGTGGRS